jgi:hypothetical protein
MISQSHPATATNIAIKHKAWKNRVPVTCGRDGGVGYWSSRRICRIPRFQQDGQEDA